MCHSTINIVVANMHAVRVLSHKKFHEPSLINKDLLKFSSINPPRTKAKISGGIGKSYKRIKVATTILVALGLFAAYVATFFVDTNILTLILSFSPGGIYEVAVIAIAFDLDPDFVAFHHIIRLLFILFTVPIFLKVLEKIKK